MRKYAYILFVMFLLGCRSDTETVEKVTTDFEKHGKKFNTLLNFFTSNLDSIAQINFTKDRIWISKYLSTNYIFLNTKSDVKECQRIKNKKQTLECIEIMEELKIDNVSGNTDWLKIVYDDSNLFYCYNVTYSKDIDQNSPYNKKKIARYNTGDPSWFYVIKDNWYIEGTNCSW